MGCLDVANRYKEVIRSPRIPKREGMTVEQYVAYLHEIIRMQRNGNLEVADRFLKKMGVNL